MSETDLLLHIVLTALNESGISDYKLVRDCGLGSAFMSDWRHGRRKSPSFDKALKILKYLHIDVNTMDLESGTFTYINDVPSSDSCSQDLNLTQDELRVITKYRALDLDGKDAVKGFIISEERRQVEYRGKTSEGNLAI